MFQSNRSIISTINNKFILLQSCESTLTSIDSSENELIVLQAELRPSWVASDDQITRCNDHLELSATKSSSQVLASF